MSIAYQLSLPLKAKPSIRDDGELPIDRQFDAGFANTLADYETYNKHLYRPNTYLHKWWARRCGSTFRLILKHLVENEEQSDYYASGGLEGKIILDPMMGGGTTLHEAIRLGTNVIGADIDPIPVLQARASLSCLPLKQLEAAFEEFYRALRDDLASFYRTACPTCRQITETRYTLYGLRRACRCGPALLVDSMLLRHEPDGSSISICPHCHSVTRHPESCGCPTEAPPLPLIEKGVRRCADCGAAYEDEKTIPFYKRYAPLAIAGHCSRHGLFFKSPASEDLAHIERADLMRAGLDFGPSEDFAVAGGPKSGDLIRQGIHTYLDLFSSRQMLYLDGAIKLLPSFDPLIRLNLAMLVSTSLEFNSMLCGYKGSDKRRPGAIRHTFSHHAYSFPYTALENNPLYPDRASGTLQNLFHDRIRRARTWALQPTERIIQNGKAHTMAIHGEIDGGTGVRDASGLHTGSRRFLLIQGSSASLNLQSDSVDFIVTDPPYFDSVQYSDLAAFFRVWLRRLIPADARWDYDLSESAVDPCANGNGRYTHILGAIFSECYRVLKKPEGRLIFTFHHWNPRGWAALTIALKGSHFALVNRYAVRSENPISVHIANLNALTHDTILVLAPRESGKAQPWELPAAIDKSASDTFCLDCGALLGWILNSELESAGIETLWRQRLD